MRFLKALAGLVAVIVLALAVVIVMDRMAQPSPPDPTPLIAKAAKYDVRIRRDTWGVPHILGKTDADTAFGLAFAQCEDDFATLQEVALAARGQLAADQGQKPRRRIISSISFASGRRSMRATKRTCRSMCAGSRKPMPMASTITRRCIRKRSRRGSCR